MLISLMCAKCDSILRRPTTAWDSQWIFLEWLILTLTLRQACKDWLPQPLHRMNQDFCRGVAPLGAYN
eukprot:5107843-Amphidinium_carterae.1